MSYIWEVNNFVNLYLNNFIINNDLEKVIWFTADFPIFFLPIFMLTAWLYFTFKTYKKEKRENLLYIFYSVIISITITNIVKSFFILERPNIIIEPILEKIPNNSFPSDHATVSFAFLFSLYAAWYKKTFWIFWIFVILMNFSRISWWLHWFFDILAWAVIWLIWTIFIFKNKKNKYIQKVNKFFFKITDFLKI